MEPSIARAQPRTIAVPRIAASHLILGVAALVVALTLGARLDYVPIWDGFEYASALHRATTGPFSLDELRFAGHASQAYALLLVAAQSLAPTEYWPTLFVNALLLAVAGVGFHRLATLAVPGPEHAMERALVTAAFVLQPALLAAVVQPGLDLPLVPGFIWATVFVLERRWIAAALTGVALVFSKETGVLLYAALGAAYVLRNPRVALGLDGRRAEAARRLAILIVPGVAFGLYLMYRKFAVQSEPAVWSAGTAMIGQSLVRQLLVPRVDRYLVTYVAIMLVLNFAWVMTLATAAGGLVAVRRAAASGSVVRAIPRWLATTPGFIVLLAVLTGFVLTRFATYANARYLLGFVGLLLVMGLVALVALPIGRGVRRAVLVGFAVLTGLSIDRTIDPVSRAVFGTFAFGEHELLRLGSITRECCALGRDQLTYNLEFTTLAAATDFALATMQAGDSTMIVLPDSTNWRTIPLVDRATGRRTPDLTAGINPLVVEADSAALFVGQRPAAIYLALPNGSGERGRQLLEAAFVVGPERRIVRNGYALSAYRLEPRR